MAHALSILPFALLAQPNATNTAIRRKRNRLRTNTPTAVAADDVHAADNFV
jgi:hypothetical protein